MENPEKEIPGIIHLMTQAPPSEQQATIYKYFTPNASITHPFVRTGSWTLDPRLNPLFERFGFKGDDTINSRWLFARIYRWYKMISPRIGVRVDGLAMDYEGSGDEADESEANGTPERRIRAAYATVRQSFNIFFWPFYRADVRLVVRLGLWYNEEDGKYYCTSQEDCYPFHEFMRFIWFGLWRLVVLLQIGGMLFCLFFSYLVFPITLYTDRKHIGSAGELQKDSWNTENGHGLTIVHNRRYRKGLTEGHKEKKNAKVK